MFRSNFQNVQVTDALLRLKLSRRLARANTQIKLLKQKIRELSVRFKNAVRHNNYPAKKNLAIRIDVTEGIRNAMYMYARDLADQLSDVIWSEIREIIIISVDFDNEDNDLHNEIEDYIDEDAEDEILNYEGRL